MFEFFYQAKRFVLRVKADAALLADLIQIVIAILGLVISILGLIFS